MTGFGVPGASLTRGNRLSQMLQSMPDTNNGTAAGGLASALQKFLIGKNMADQQGEENNAQQIMAQAMQAMQGTPASTIQWDQPTRPDGTGEATTPVAAVAPNRNLAMSLLASNPRTAEIGYGLAVKDMDRAAEAAAKQVKTLTPEEAKARGLPPGAYQLDAFGKVTQVAKPEPVQTPNSVREFEYAKSNGYTGSFEDFKKMSGAQGSQETFGNTPIWGEDVNGNPVLMQPSNRGGLRLAQVPAGVTPTRGQTSRVDLGTEWAILDANGNLIGKLPKDNAGKARDEEIGKGAGVAVVAGGKKGVQAEQTLSLLDGVDSLIDQSTGSLVGAGRDIAASAVGIATPGAEAAAKLKVLQANLMLSMPRMEGPQSDRDVNLYREAAAQLGDEKVPAAIKKAAVATIKQINERYKTAAPATPPAAAGGWSATKVSP